MAKCQKCRGPRAKRGVNGQMGQGPRARAKMDKRAKASKDQNGQQSKGQTGPMAKRLKWLRANGQKRSMVKGQNGLKDQGLKGPKAKGQAKKSPSENGAEVVKRATAQGPRA